MALRRGRGAQGNGLDAWPGYVDALSTLLMVIIFVLLVFVLAQAFLSVALNGREQALDRVNRQLAEMSDMLSLERGRSNGLAASVAGLTRDLGAATTARDDLTRQLAALGVIAAATARDRDTAARDRDAARAERDRLTGQLAGAATQAISAAGDLAEARRLLAERDATIKADRATIDARLADLARLDQQNRALAALRDDLAKQVGAAAAAATSDADKRAALQKLLSSETSLGDTQRAQLALLNQQVGELRAQMTQLSRDLDLAYSAMADKDTQITNLGSKLNAALASKVEELQRYRSEFFGKLRAVLANRPGIQVVGDRFVFQSEVLFPPGSAEMTGAGQDQIRALATTIKQIAAEIPADQPWILRVDGHADRTPIANGSNWELSSERAINVVKLLIDQGVPATHLAATAFADNQPLDPASTPDAFARNRRIELRLTDR